MSSINSNAIDAITEGIDRVDILDSKVQKCASCGKEGTYSDMNTCNKCKSVKYCNAACKKKHRSKHKKACERRVAELYDEELFKEVEPEECPICMLPMPLDSSQVSFRSCCGKTVCCGCLYGMLMRERKDICAFCRSLQHRDDKEKLNRLKKLMDKGSACSYNVVAFSYDNGMTGLPRNRAKANELYLKAGELGYAGAYYNLGNSYYHGWGVEVDKIKAQHFYELAAMGGNVDARHNVGVLELRAGNYHRAYKHFILAAKAGNEKSLDIIKEGVMVGDVTKHEYASALRAHHDRQKEMKSDERDKAAASGQYSSG